MIIYLLGLNLYSHFTRISEQLIVVVVHALNNQELTSPYLFVHALNNQELTSPYLFAYFLLINLHKHMQLSFTITFYFMMKNNRTNFYKIQAMNHILSGAAVLMENNYNLKFE